MRIVALSAVAVAVLGFGVYLLVQVQTGPAGADPVTHGSAQPIARGSDTVTSPHPALVPARPARPAMGPATGPVAATDGATDPAAGSGSSGSAVAQAGSAVPEPHVHRPTLFQAPGHGGSKAKIDHMLDESARAYDAGNYERAKAIASKIASRQPDNARALQILTVTACAQNDAATAQGYYNRLPPTNRDAAKASCSGVQLQDPP